MNLDELRMEIDKVDDQLIRLFAQRMDIAAQIAEYKKQHNLPVLNAAREREKLSMITDASREDMKDNMRVLYSLSFELSRAYQNRLLDTTTEQYELIHDAIENTPKLFPKRANVVLSLIHI